MCERVRESAQSVIVINVHFKNRLKRIILTSATPKNFVKTSITNHHGHAIFKLINLNR